MKTKPSEDKRSEWVATLEEILDHEKGHYKEQLMFNLEKLIISQRLLAQQEILEWVSKEIEKNKEKESTWDYKQDPSWWNGYNSGVGDSIIEITHKREELTK